MKKIILSTVATLALSSSVYADFIGLEAGYSAWNPVLSGTIKGKNSNDININLKNDLGYDKKTNNSFFWVSFDHPVPVLPNIKLQKTNFSTSSTATKSITYDGLNYTGTISSELTLNQTDIIPYYRVLDNWVNFDIGLNFKIIDGNVKLSDSAGTTNTNKDFSAVIPMLYAKARFDMPFTGLSVETDASYIAYNGSSFTDMKAAVVYETSYGLGVNLGYRIENLTIDDVSDTNANVDINGLYLGVFYHF